jgi:hypothetical protein
MVLNHVRTIDGRVKAPFTGSYVCLGSANRLLIGIGRIDATRKWRIGATPETNGTEFLHARGSGNQVQYVGLAKGNALKGTIEGSNDDLLTQLDHLFAKWKQIGHELSLIDTNHIDVLHLGQDLKEIANRNGIELFAVVGAGQTVAVPVVLTVPENDGPFPTHCVPFHTAEHFRGFATVHATQYDFNGHFH